jgi:hypothetical protein
VLTLLEIQRDVEAEQEEVRADGRADDARQEREHPSSTWQPIPGGASPS